MNYNIITDSDVDSFVRILSSWKCRITTRIEQFKYGSSINRFDVATELSNTIGINNAITTVLNGFDYYDIRKLVHYNIWNVETIQTIRDYSHEFAHEMLKVEIM